MIKSAIEEENRLYQSKPFIELGLHVYQSKRTSWWSGSVL